MRRNGERLKTTTKLAVKRDELVQKLYTAQEALEQALKAYNEVLKEADSFIDKQVEEMRELANEQPSSWTQWDQFDDWLLSWECLDMFPVELYGPLGHAAELEQLDLEGPL